jgi:alginate O-acetyltransferase complex protein AlgI
MAIGMARMFGFPFPENFNLPYVATSVTDFWRRWHISLTSWFRDYLYVPLTGNRVWTPAWRVYLSVFAVFFLCGLWHGAKTTFVVWGIVHGAALVVERLFLLRVLERVPRVLRHLYCLTFIVVSWAIFRADDLAQAAGVLQAMFTGGAASGLHSVGRYLDGHVAVVLLAGAIGSTPWLPSLAGLLERKRQRRSGDDRATAFDLAFRGIGHLTLIGILLLSFAQIAAGTYNPFIYFRF